MNSFSARLEVLFTPAEFAALAHRDLRQTSCVVFDVFRATSTIVAALGNGAAGVIPVAEIPEAVALRRDRPEVLLAGERNGWRISAALTGGIEFDLGNSPREFTRGRVAGRTVVLSTTNGSRALRACGGAGELLAASFPNLRATADHLRARPAENILLVCSGTAEQAAFEDVLGAGALASLLWPADEAQATDSARMARLVYERHEGDLIAAVSSSSNGRRLLGVPELRDDVPWCLQRDVFDFAAISESGVIRILGKT
jgi:2-phosphosulfolactate phosphatase